MTEKWKPCKERAADIERLASEPEKSPLVISAIARRDIQDLADNIESFLAHTSTLTTTASKAEELISTAEKRARGGLLQWIKVLFGALSREQCLAEALPLLDSIRLRMDSLAMLATDVREGIEDSQIWIDALQDSGPRLPGDAAREAARSRVRDLKAMVANGENTFSPYANLTEKAEALQAWSLRAQNSLETCGTPPRGTDT